MSKNLQYSPPLPRVCFVLRQVGQVSVRASKSLDFSTEDQVPGLMWLPTGLKDVATGDPWVTMCLVDYKHYQVGGPGRRVDARG